MDVPAHPQLDSFGSNKKKKTGIFSAPTSCEVPVKLQEENTGGGEKALLNTAGRSCRVHMRFSLKNKKKPCPLKKKNADFSVKWRTVAFIHYVHLLTRTGVKRGHVERR